MLAFLGFSVIVTVICLAIGVKVVAEMQTQNYDTVTHDVTNETNTSTITLPSTLTLTNIPVVSGSESLYIWNATANYGTLTKDVNYTVLSYTLGTFNITTYRDGVASNSVNINATYQYTTQESNAMTDILANGLTGLNSLSDWIPIIIIVIVGAFVIMYLVKTFMPLGMMGSRTGE